MAAVYNCQTWFLIWKPHPFPTRRFKVGGVIDSDCMIPQIIQTAGGSLCPNACCC